MLSDDQYEGLALFCRERLRSLAEQRQILDCLQKRFYGSPILEVHGEIYHPISDVGTVCTNALQEGLGLKYGIPSLPNLQEMLISRKSSQIALSCGFISMPPALPKNGDQSIGRSRGGLTTKIHALVDELDMLALTM